MKIFEFTRPADARAAIADAARAKSAQQGADVRFLAGGTTLIDLMKLNVETPARLLDINRLPFDKIEAAHRRELAANRGESAFARLTDLLGDHEIVSAAWRFRDSQWK